MVKADDTEELPSGVPTGSRSPSHPYGHPDLLLGRAAAGLTAEAGELISSTQFGDALIEQLAAEQGVTAPVLRMRRRCAERVRRQLVRDRPTGRLAGALRADVRGTASSAGASGRSV